MALGALPPLVTPADLASLPAADAGDLLLLIAIGGRRFALPVGPIVRLLPMAAPTPLPDAPADILGALHFAGALWPIVDPRARLGLPPVAPHPSQQLVALDAARRYLLWIDRAEAIVRPDGAPVAAPGGGTTAPRLARIGADYLPLLAPAAFAPAGPR